MLQQTLTVTSVFSGNEVDILQNAYGSRRKITEIAYRCRHNIKTRIHCFPL